ncbi:MAG: hypothetical protein VYE15_07265, partial [Myxococcota bacterium]|nr:hypothetical protein [Myxococcota bacterium]
LGQGCIYPQLVCEAPDACSTSLCSPETGACEVVFSCDDSDPCTLDLCEDGVCSHAPDEEDPSCGG